MYKEENVAISGTHTHAGPGGYLQYVMYSVTSLGFVQQSFAAIVTAIELSIVQAHNNLKPGSIFINKGRNIYHHLYELMLLSSRNHENRDVALQGTSRMQG